MAMAIEGQQQEWAQSRRPRHTHTHAQRDERVSKMRGGPYLHGLGLGLVLRGESRFPLQDPVQVQSGAQV